LINAPYEREFVFQDGSRARNILDLVYKVDSMSDSEFHSFVNVYKNDFANWIEHVLLDKQFADLLRETVSKVDTLNLLKEKALEISENMTHSLAFGGIVRPKRFATSHLESYHTTDNSQAGSPDLNNYHNLHPHSDTHHSHPKENKHQDKKDAKHEHKEHKTQHKTEQEREHKIENKKQEYKEESKKEDKKETETKELDKKEDKKEVRKKEDQKEISSEIPKNIPSPVSEEMEKPKRRWFDFFSKKDESEKELEKAEKALQRGWEKELGEVGNYAQEKENNLWVILYIGLVLLIITLLVYKLFLN